MPKDLLSDLMECPVSNEELTQIPTATSIENALELIHAGQRILLMYSVEQTPSCIFLFMKENEHLKMTIVRSYICGVPLPTPNIGGCNTFTVPLEEARKYIEKPELAYPKR